MQDARDACATNQDKNAMGGGLVVRILCCIASEPRRRPSIRRVGSRWRCEVDMHHGWGVFELMVPDDHRDSTAGSETLPSLDGARCEISRKTATSKHIHLGATSSSSFLSTRAMGTMGLRNQGIYFKGFEQPAEACLQHEGLQVMLRKTQVQDEVDASWVPERCFSERTIQ
ncbi:hypothetical protein AB1N83_012337 [Pleurotus pulmonarius]